MVHGTLAYQDPENVMARADRLDTLIVGRYSIGMGGRFRPSSKDTKKKSLLRGRPYVLGCFRQEDSPTSYSREVQGELSRQIVSCLKPELSRPQLSLLVPMVI